MSLLSVEQRLYLLRNELAPYRETGADLDAAQISYICRVLAVCAADAEQMAMMLGLSSPVVIDPADDKVVCLARFRSRPTSSPPPRPHPGGGDAA